MFALVLAGAWLGCAPGPGTGPEEPAAASAAPGPVAAAPTPSRRCDAIVRIEVDKSSRTLRLECAGGTRVLIDVALSRRGLGAKVHAGDHLTPEGSYRIAGEPRASRFHVFIPIDYPSVADADRALRDGEISIEDHRRIVAAHERGEAPPGDTPLGGGIGLHGRGERWHDVDPRVDWTLGCVALSDETIEFVAERVAPGVPVEIRR